MFKVLILLFISILSISRADEKFMSIKELSNLSKNIEFSNYVSINGGKMETKQSSKAVYFTRLDYYTIKTSLTTPSKDLVNFNKTFLKSWLKARYSSERDYNSDNVIYYIAGSQLDTFYEEINLVEDGKIYNFLIQKPVAEKIRKEKLVGKAVELEVAFLGFINSSSLNNNSNYFLITNCKLATNSVKKEQTTTTALTKEYSSAKNDIKNGNYDVAVRRLRDILAKVPNSIETRKELCNALYLKYLKNTSKTGAVDAINCYESVVKMADKPDVHYALAFLYNQEEGIELKKRQTEILKNLNLVIDLLSKNSYLNNDEKIMYYNSLYLRGIFKLSINDKSGIDDLIVVQQERPDLVNADLFTK